MEDVAIALRNCRHQKEVLSKEIAHLKEAIGKLKSDLDKSTTQEQALSSEFYELHEANLTQLQYGIHNPQWLLTSEEATPVDTLEHRWALAHSFYEILRVEIEQNQEEVNIAESSFSIFLAESQERNLALDQEWDVLIEQTRLAHEEFVRKQDSVQRLNLTVELMKQKVESIEADSSRQVKEYIKELFADKPLMPAFLTRALL